MLIHKLQDKADEDAHPYTPSDRHGSEKVQQASAKSFQEGSTLCTLWGILSLRVTRP